MGIARYGGQTFRIALAENPALKQAVYGLRAREYAAAQSYLAASDDYDERSFIFGCWLDGQAAPVASCRFATPLAGRFELDDLVSAWPRPPVPADSLVEVSRVVVARDHRATGLVEVLLLVAGSWLLTHTPHRCNFAVCARPLERLYARLGMRLTSVHELTLRGRPAEKRYVVIHGDMAASQASVLDRLTRRGWDITLDYPEQKVGT